MVDASIQSQLAACLNELEIARQRQVLEFAIHLRAQPGVGVPGEALLRFAGKIDEADLNSISTTLAEGCERIDAYGW